MRITERINSWWNGGENAAPKVVPFSTNKEQNFAENLTKLVVLGIIIKFILILAFLLYHLQFVPNWGKNAEIARGPTEQQQVLD